MVKDGSMEVDMSQGICGIKGTTFVIGDSQGISSLKVIEGNVQFTSKTTGQNVMVGTGQSVQATSSGLGKATPFNATAEQASWDAVRAQIPASSSGNPSATKAGTGSDHGYQSRSPLLSAPAGCSGNNFNFSPASSNNREISSGMLAIGTWDVGSSM